MGEGCVKSVEDACWVCQCATFAILYRCVSLPLCSAGLNSTIQQSNDEEGR